MSDATGRELEAAMRAEACGIDDTAPTRGGRWHRGGVVINPGPTVYGGAPFGYPAQPPSGVELEALGAALAAARQRTRG